MERSNVPFSPFVRKTTIRRLPRPLRNASAPPQPMISSSGWGETIMMVLLFHPSKGLLWRVTSACPSKSEAEPSTAARGRTAAARSLSFMRSLSQHLEPVLDSQLHRRGAAYELRDRRFGRGLRRRCLGPDAEP